MAALKQLIRILVVAPIAAAAVACGGSTSPTSPPAACVTTITLGIFPNGAPPSPGQGMVWTSYFAATTLPAGSSVYVMDINATPAGCLTGWTAVSANTSAVQLSPASGTGRGQVELFIPPNSGTSRATVVTIAGQGVTITQSGQ